MVTNFIFCGDYLKKLAAISQQFSLGTLSLLKLKALIKSGVLSEMCAIMLQWSQYSTKVVPVLSPPTKKKVPKGLRILF